jgi:flagellar biosynthesis protein FlgN
MADHNRLISIKLNEQLDCLASLSALLTEELSAIASRRGEGLKEITQQKMAFLTTLSALDKELSSLLASNDEQTSEISEQITLIRSQLEQCQQQNEVNAHAAHQAQLSVKQLKDILIGAPSSMTYDQAGSVINSDSHLVRNLKA